MKKIIVWLWLLLLMPGFALYAETSKKEERALQKKQDEQNKKDIREGNLRILSEPGSNCYISLSGGVQALLNESNFKSYREEQKGFFTGAGSLSLGKFFTPWNALQLSILGGQSALYSYYNKETGLHDNTESTPYTKFFANASIDFLFDVTHIISSFRPYRLFSFYLYAGPGVSLADIYDTSGDKSQNFSPVFNATAGMILALRMSKSFQFFVDMRGWITPSFFGDYSMNYTEGTLSAMGGFTYTIDSKKYVPYVRKSYSDALVVEAGRSVIDCQRALDEANKNLLAARSRDSLSKVEMDKLRADAQAAIDEAMRQKQQSQQLQNQPKGTNIVTVTKTDTIVKTIIKEKILMSAAPMAIFFEENMSAIDDRGLINIQLAADAMKTTPNRKYKLIGYTDINRSESSMSSNKSLSIKRAKKVYDELVRLGVNPAQLSYTGMGPQENMFGTNELNRVVLIEAVPEKTDN